MRFYLDYTNRRHKNYGAGTLAGYGTHTRGWNAGARVTCHGDKDERDSFSVYMTSGSGGSRGDRLLGTVHDTAEGPMWEPAGGDIPTGRVEIREVVREVRTPTPRDMQARVILASALINRDLDGEQEIPGLGEALARTLFGRLAELAGTPAAS